MNTFSYCGISSDAFGCYYASNESERFNDRSDFQVYSDEPDWYNGGIYYGSTLKPKEFELNCYYEDISRKTKERMLAWLDRRTSGKLVFDHMPWKYYMVRPTKRMTGKEYTHTDGYGHDTYSGVFTIYFTAYEPWAYIDVVGYKAVNRTISFFVDNEWNMNVGVDTPSDFTPAFTMNNDRVLYVLSDDDHRFSTNSDRQLLLQSTGEEESRNDYHDYLFDPGYEESITTESRSFNLYNIGTEPTYPVIRIGGSVGEGGLKITNNTNGTVCGITALPDESSYLEIDCAHGVVYLVDGRNKSVEFSYHDLGFISLEPCGMIDNDVSVTYAAGSNVIHITDRVYEESAVGKYLLIAGSLYRIIAQTAEGYIISGRPDLSGTDKVTLFTMNSLSVSGSDVSLNKLEIEFTPRVQ